MKMNSIQNHIVAHLIVNYIFPVVCSVSGCWEKLVPVNFVSSSGEIEYHSKFFSFQWSLFSCVIECTFRLVYQCLNRFS